MENPDLFIKVVEGQWVWRRGQEQGEDCKEDQGMYCMREE